MNIKLGNMVSVKKYNFRVLLGVNFYLVNFCHTSGPFSSFSTLD